LGHPTPRILNLLVSNNKIVCTSRCSLAQCQAYPLDKSSRLSLRPTGYKTTTPHDLIFSDVWGSAPFFLLMASVTLLHLSMHIPTFIVLPLIAKFDVFSIFHHFQTLVECQFSHKIKSIQTDWVVNIVS